MGKSKQPDEVTQISEPWGPAQPFIRDIMSQAQGLQQSGPSLTAPFDPLQQQGQQGAIDYAGALPTLTNQNQAAAMFGLSPDILSPQSNPALQGTIEAGIRPVQQQLTESILPALRSQGTMYGDGGTNTRQGMAEGIASGRALDTMGDISSRIASQGYGQGLQHQARTSALLPQTMQAGLMPSQILGGVGGQRRGLQLEQQMEPYQRLQNYANTINPMGGLGGSVTSPSFQQGGGLMGALGGAATGAGLAGALGMGAWPLALLGGIGGLWS